MSFRTTIVLFVIVLAGGAAFWFVQSQDQNRPPVEKPVETPKTQRLLPDGPDADQVVRVSVECPDKPAITMERAPTESDPNRLGDWRMTAPVPSETEAPVVMRLVRSFTLVESKDQYKPGELSARDAGLDPPAARVTVEGRDGRRETVELGRKVAIGNDIYARRAGSDTIHVIGEQPLKEAREDAARYRSRALARFAVKDVVEIDLALDGKQYQLRRGDNNQWRIESPVVAQADADKVRALLGDLLALRVAEFLPETPAEPAAYGFNEPYLRVQVVTETLSVAPPDPAESQPAVPRIDTRRETFALLIGNPADIGGKDRFVQVVGQPWIATIADIPVQKVTPKLGELRDPRVVRLREADITRLELASAGQSAVLEKIGGEWEGAGDLDALELPALTDVLQALEDLRAVDFIDTPGDLAQYGLDRPRATLKVASAGAPGVVTLRLGAATPSGQNAYVQLDENPSVLVINERQAQRLALSPLALRARQVFAYEPRAVRSVELTRGDRAFRMVRTDDGWQLEQPAGAPVDPASSREISTDLARLRARRVVGKIEQAAQFGLSQPEVDIRFTAEKAAEALVGPETPSTAPAAVMAGHTLRIGRAGGVTYASRDDDPYVYELDDTVYNSLTQELIQRQALDLDPKAVVGLRIESTGGTLEFKREETGWVYPADLTVQLNQKAVDDLVAEFAKLRIERYITYENADLAAAGLDQAPATLTLRLSDDSTVTLKLDQLRPGEVPRKAGWVEQRRIFVLRIGEAERLMRGLDEYVKRDAPPPQPGQPGLPPGLGGG
jgi:hypothetical protein